MASSNHIIDAEGYALGVISGLIPASKLVISAVKRHVSDLETPNSPYYFDPEKGARVCRYIENLPHTKGKWARSKDKIKLQPWQSWLLITGFGWLRKKDGKRRFSRFYWEIPRKNGKSLLAGGVGNYMLTSDGEFGAEVYSGATSERQAWEVFGPARLMMERTPDFARHLGVAILKTRLVRYEDGSKFEPIVGTPGDGSSPSCAIIDEYHEHQTPAQFNSMQTGMGSREQPILLVITTAGANIAGPCYEAHEEAEKVLQGVLDVPELFAVIFGVDVGDDWTDPQILYKANPNLGVSIDEDWLKQQQRNALASPAQQAIFKTKHMNVWAQVMAGAFNMEDWLACEDKLMDEAEFAECDCWISNDMASKLDLCAQVRTYRRHVDDKPHYYLFSRFWLPEDEINEPGANHAHYKKWETQGFLMPTDGAEIDFKLITAETIAECKRINPLEFVYDPFNAIALAQDIANAGTITVEFAQLPQNFAVPIDELRTAMKTGRLHHDGNPLMTWCMSNVVARPAKKGLISPIKLKPHQKIDGAIAGIMTMARAAAPWQSGMEDALKDPVII